MTTPLVGRMVKSELLTPDKENVMESPPKQIRISCQRNFRKQSEGLNQLMLNMTENDRKSQCAMLSSRRFGGELI